MTSCRSSLDSNSKKEELDASQDVAPQAFEPIDGPVTFTGSHDEENVPHLDDGTSADNEKNEPERTTSKKDESFLVHWEPNEAANPLNWSHRRKVWATLQLAHLALAASVASSIISPANAVIAEQTNVSREAAVLSISLFILGFCFGPSLWAPISELWGRRFGLLPAMVGLGLFSIGTATSQNAASIFVTRFFGGIFGSAPVSNVSAAIADIWEPRVRGLAMAAYSMTVVGGPTLGPVIGGALVANKHLGWRWTQ